MEPNENPKRAPTIPPPVIERPVPCACGSHRFREAHRIVQTGGGVSVMYECVACGEYRL